MGNGKEHESAENAVELVQVEGVPHIQADTFWCGEASLSMLLGHLGYPHLTPKVIHEKAKEGYDPETHGSRTDMLTGGDPYQDKHPDIKHLSRLVKELTNGEVEAQIKGTKEYDEINALRIAKGDDPLKPFDILDLNLRGGRPCMIRTTGHFLVVAGFTRGSTMGERYLIYDSREPGPRLLPRTAFEASWADREIEYPRKEKPLDTSYLMMYLKRPGKRVRV